MHDGLQQPVALLSNDHPNSAQMPRRTTPTLLAALAILTTGCGGSDKTTDPVPVASPQRAAEQTLDTFAGHLRAANDAVDQFMSAYRDCLDTPGCARTETARALKLVDTALQAAGPYTNADPETCGQAFVQVRDGLADQYKAVEAMSDGAGNADAANAATDRMNAATDTIGQGVEAIQTDC